MHSFELYVESMVLRPTEDTVAIGIWDEIGGCNSNFSFLVNRVELKQEPSADGLSRLIRRALSVEPWDAPGAVQRIILEVDGKKAWGWER